MLIFMSKCSCHCCSHHHRCCRCHSRHCNHHHYCCCRRNYHGFSLIEVLIAMFILAFSLIALADFVTAAWRRTCDASYMSMGISSAANRAEAAYAKDNSEQYHNVWRSNVMQALPHGEAKYVGKTSVFHTIVCWQRLFRHEKSCYQLP